MDARIIKRLLLLIVKFVVSAFLLALVFRKAGFSNILSHLRSMDLRFFILSSILYIVSLYFSALRWSMLLVEHHPLHKLFSLYLIGSFFNHLLPGSIGGDAVKAYYICRDTRSSVIGIGSVFMDRYVGFFGLLTVGMVSWLIAFNDLSLIRMQWVIPILFLFFILGSFLFFRLKIGSRFSAVSDFYDYFHRAMRKKGAILKAYFLSVFVQAISILMIYLVARGLRQQLPFTALFVFVPIINIISVVPISISGLGVRESAFVVLFGLSGIPPETSTTISFLWFVSIAASSLLGLVEYLRLKTIRS